MRKREEITQNQTMAEGKNERRINEKERISKKKGKNKIIVAVIVNIKDKKREENGGRKRSEGKKST